MRKFSQGMSQMRRQGATSSANVEKSLGGIGTKLTSIAFLAKTALGSALVVGARNAVREFALLEGSMAKFEVVFADQAGDMDRWVDTFRTRVPLARREIVQMSASLQDLLIPMGIARNEATGMTQEWLELAGALAAFNDVGVTEVLEAMQSAIAGQSRPLRRFGIDVRETALQQTALENGIIGVNDSMNESARQQALLIQAYAQSKDAIDGYEDQLGSTLMKEQELGATFKDTASIIGRVLQPGYNRMTATITTFLSVIGETFGSVNRQLMDTQSAIDRAFKDTATIDDARFAIKSLSDMIALTKQEIEVAGASDALNQRLESLTRSAIELSAVMAHLSLQDPLQETAESINNLPPTVGALKEEISDLEQKINDSFNTEDIARYQHQIQALQIDIAKLTGTFQDLKPTIENLPPVYDHIFPPDMPVTRILSDLEMAEQAILGVVEAWENNDFGHRIETELDKASGAAQFFSRTLGDGLENVLFQAQSVEDALKNIIRQLASRALVTGLMALFSGGLPQNVSFGRAMFGGGFHTGGIIPGVGEKTINAQGGEMILSRDQVKGMGSGGGAKDINLTIHIRGDLQGRGDTLRALIDEQVRQSVRLT